MYIFLWPETKTGISITASELFKWQSYLAQNGWCNMTKKSNPILFGLISLKWIRLYDNK